MTRKHQSIYVSVNTREKHLMGIRWGRNKHFNFNFLILIVFTFYSHPKQISTQVAFSPSSLPWPYDYHIHVYTKWKRRESRESIFCNTLFFLFFPLKIYQLIPLYFSFWIHVVSEKNIFLLNINFLLAHTNKFTSNQQGRPSVTFDIILSKFYLKSKK